MFNINIKFTIIKNIYVFLNKIKFIITVIIFFYKIKNTNINYT